MDGCQQLFLIRETVVCLLFFFLSARVLAYALTTSTKATRQMAGVIVSFVVSFKVFLWIDGGKTHPKLGLDGDIEPVL